jgi:hypothetical protein
MRKRLALFALRFNCIHFFSREAFYIAGIRSQISSIKPAEDVKTSQDIKTARLYFVTSKIIFSWHFCVAKIF